MENKQINTSCKAHSENCLNSAKSTMAMPLTSTPLTLSSQITEHALLFKAPSPLMCKQFTALSRCLVHRLAKVACSSNLDRGVVSCLAIGSRDPNSHSLHPVDKARHHPTRVCQVATAIPARQLQLAQPREQCPELSRPQKQHPHSTLSTKPAEGLCPNLQDSRTPPAGECHRHRT
jgi:hypothetical protein